MPSEGQLIHTSGYFFRNTDIDCPSNAILGERRRDKSRLSANDSILVVWKGFHVRVADTEERQINAPTVLLHFEADFIEERIARHAACQE